MLMVEGLYPELLPSFVIPAVEPPRVDLANGTLEVPIEVDGQIVQVYGKVQQVDDELLRFSLEGEGGNVYFKQRGAISEAWIYLPEGRLPSAVHPAISSLIERLTEYSITGPEGQRQIHAFLYGINLRPFVLSGVHE